MRFMVIERYKHGAQPVYQRFAARGRMLPPGLRYLDSWIIDEDDVERCFQLMETDDPSLLEQWTDRWSDLVDFEVHAVINSTEAAKRSAIDQEPRGGATSDVAGGLPAVTAPDDAGIEPFFASYRDAFNARDAVKIARHYRIPSLLVTNRGSISWATDDDVLANMRDLLRAYHDDGFDRAKFEIAGIQLLGRRHAVIDVAWTTMRDRGSPPRHFRTGYNLSRSADGWRIDVCTAYDE